MKDNPLHPLLGELCNKLDQLAQNIENGWSDNRPLMDNWGWNFPAVSRHALARTARDLAIEIRASDADTLDDPLIAIFKEWISNVEKIRTGTVPYFYNGHGAQAVPVYLNALDLLRLDLKPILGWQGIRDVNLLPPKLARRIRSYQAELDQIAPNKEELKQQIELIREATSAAESLPTDLQALSNAKTNVENIQSKTGVMSEKVQECLKNAEASKSTIKRLEDDASKLVAQCEEAYKITTTKGLAGAFSQRHTNLSLSMWAWVIFLVITLGAGYYFGGERLNAIAGMLKSASENQGLIWPNIVLAIFSFGAPIWLAWIATKQVGQRFRLAEDYAYKAAVAKAYEGYRKEAARIDKAFEARLFQSALTRLEEAPLRLVEGAAHGSPWHEFIDSEAFKTALKSVPGLSHQFRKVQKRGSKPMTETDPESVGG